MFVDKDEVHNLFMNFDHVYYPGFMTKHYSHSWANKNSAQQLHQQPLHSVKVTVLCVTPYFGIIGCPPPFQDDHEYVTLAKLVHKVHVIQTFHAKINSLSTSK